MAITVKDLRDNWMIIVAFTAGAAAWGGMGITLSYAKDDIKVNATETAKIKDQITDIKVAAEGVKAASEAQQRATERQLDQIIQQLQQFNSRVR